VLFLLLPEVNLLDLAGPAQVFSAATDLGRPFEQVFCAQQSDVRSAQGLVFAQLEPLVEVRGDDLILVPGLQLRREPAEAFRLHPEVSRWLAQAHVQGAHLASVCTGAFALGEAGLLNKRRCTTHWMSVDDLQARYPQAQVLDRALFVNDRRITTSAGIASGIDMALSLLEQQYGPLFTAQVARYLVVYLRRNGSHSQESVYLQYRTHLSPAVHCAQDYLIAHVTEPIALSELARVAAVSTRSLSRMFKDATGLTPVQYHQRLRLELASNLFSNPELSIEEIARTCGFEDARHFRRIWQRQFGTSPSASRWEQKHPADNRGRRKHFSDENIVLEG
jgi:transcriptional regulator GlxA family with amidase domain